MEEKNAIEQEITAVRNEIRGEQNQLSQDSMGPSNPAVLAQLNADERVLQTLERKEERAKAHGFGY